MRELSHSPGEHRDTQEDVLRATLSALGWSETDVRGYESLPLMEGESQMALADRISYLGKHLLEDADGQAERAQFFSDRTEVVEEAQTRERLLRHHYDKLVVDAAAALPVGYSPALDGLPYASTPEPDIHAPKALLAYEHVALRALADHYGASPAEVYQIAPSLDLPLIGPGLCSGVATEVDIRGDQHPHSQLIRDKLAELHESD